MTLGELRRALVTIAVLLTVLYVFLGMISSVFLAGILGVVAGVYLIPLAHRPTHWIANQSVAAILSLALLLPVVAVVAYGYMELEQAVDYLVENRESVAAEFHHVTARRTREIGLRMPSAPRAHRCGAWC